MVSVTTKVASLSPTRCAQRSLFSSIAASPSVKHVIGLLGIQEMNSDPTIPTLRANDMDNIPIILDNDAEVQTFEQEWMLLLGNTVPQNPPSRSSTPRAISPPSASSSSNSSPVDCSKPHYVANLHFPLRVIGTAFTATCIFWGWVIIFVAQTTTKLLCYPVTDSHQRAVVCARILNGVSYYTTTLMNPLWKVTILKPLLPPSTSPSYDTLTDKNAHNVPISTWLKKTFLSEPTTKKPCIYVINHLSNADPWICSSAGMPSEAVWICKGALFKVPFGGWAIANSGHLKVEFTKEKNGWGTKKGAVKRMMEKARECIRSGRSVGVYPEGVRNLNPDGPIGEFKLGFFSLAVEMGIDVVPVALTGTEKMWPVNEKLFDKSHAYVSFGEPIASIGETAESLRDKAHQVITEMRDQHPDRAAYLRGREAVSVVSTEIQGEITLPIPVCHM